MSRPRFSPRRTDPNAWGYSTSLSRWGHHPTDAEWAFKDRDDRRAVQRAVREGRPFPPNGRGWHMEWVPCEINCGWAVEVPLRRDRNGELYPEEEHVREGQRYYHRQFCSGKPFGT